MRNARRGADQLQRRPDRIGGGMHGAGNQPVHLVQRQHHRAEHDVVFKLLFGLRGGQPLGAPQRGHRLDIARAHRSGVDDLHVGRAARYPAPRRRGGSGPARPAARSVRCPCAGRSPLPARCAVRRPRAARCVCLPRAPPAPCDGGTPAGACEAGSGRPIRRQQRGGVDVLGGMRERLVHAFGVVGAHVVRQAGQQRQPVA